MSKPIIYKNIVDIHFSYIDAFGHVNAKHYLDLVATSRLWFLERDMQMPLPTLMKAGYGFYLKKAVQNFRRPIIGLQGVLVTSYVAAVRDATLEIPFEIRTKDDEKVFADGILEYAVMDLNQMRPVPPPKMMLDLFFTNKIPE